MSHQVFSIHKRMQYLEIDSLHYPRIMGRFNEWKLEQSKIEKVPRDAQSAYSGNINTSLDIRTGLNK